ncbi:MAG: hypothetical protein WCV99_08075 [Sterolibacterium sp.]
MKIDLRKIYKFEALEIEVDTALPSGGDVFYECTKCKNVVSSVPYTSAECECGNLKGNKGSITIADPSLVKPVRGRLK